MKKTHKMPKTTMRYHLTPARMVKIKDGQVLGRWGDSQALRGAGARNGADAVESGQHFLRRLIAELSCGPASPLLAAYTQEK